MTVRGAFGQPVFDAALRERIDEFVEANAGQFEADAPVQRYLPWFRVADADASARITLRHLLNQTSGLSRADGMAPLLQGTG